MNCATYYPTDITKLFYSPEEEAGANCLEEWEKAELTASPLVETLRLFLKKNFNAT